jgi:hypothetical protein
MRLIVIVFDALQATAGPCTRLHIEQLTGLTKWEVREGLDGLRRRRMLQVYGRPRETATYELTRAAVRPEDLRGRRPKDEDTRARIGEGVARYRASAHAGLLRPPSPAVLAHRAAAPASHRFAAGAARTKNADLNVGCLLQNLWRKR